MTFFQITTLLSKWYKCVDSNEIRNTYAILVRQAEGKRPFVRPRHRWKEKVKTAFKEMRSDGLHLTGSECEHVAGSSEHGSSLLQAYSMKAEIRDQPSYY